MLASCIDFDDRELECAVENELLRSRIRSQEHNRHVTIPEGGTCTLGVKVLVVINEIRTIK